MGETHEHHHHEHVPSHKEAFAVEGASVSLEAHMHEEAATVSLGIKPVEGEGFAFTRIIDAMTAIAEQAESQGGIVGHIKGSAREGAAFAHASVTASDLPCESEGDVEAAFGSDATIQIVAIVLLIEQQDLVGICKAAL